MAHRRDRRTFCQGATWPVAKTVNVGASAYSCPAVPPDGTIVCLYERGARNPYETLSRASTSPG